MDLKKYIKRWYAQFIAWRYEHKLYSADKKNALRYLLVKEEGANRLVVVFPACWDGGAKYDYVRTIMNTNCHKIFLLDDSAANHRGNYLMGEDKKELVITLLKEFINKNKIDKVIFCGSSKGGTSALYFSYLIPNVDVYIGAPQYHVGTYLNNEVQWPNLTSLLGCEPTQEKIDALDSHIQNLFLTSHIIPNSVHLLYSNKEHTYDEHIRDMIIDIKQRNINLEEIVLDFTNHSDVGKYFALYLKEQLEQL